ncbi:MAG: hypothetical protein ACTHOB_15230 [Ginsengibacter sp.]
MKNLRIATFVLILFDFVSCTHKLHPQTNSQVSVIDILQEASQKVRKEAKHGISTRIYQRRMDAVKLFNIETDTSKLNRFIVIDIENFEGEDYLGEIRVNDSLLYYYSSSYFLSNNKVVIKKEEFSPFATKKTEELIFDYLKSHRFAKLEALANKKGKSLSGSSFYNIGMYEKGMDSVYVKTVPAFIIN